MDEWMICLQTHLFQTWLLLEIKIFSSETHKRPTLRHLTFSPAKDLISNYKDKLCHLGDEIC